MPDINRPLRLRELNAAAFSPFGQLIDLSSAERFRINSGTTTRFNDLVTVETAGSRARPLVNLFRARYFEPPIVISMMERHPLGSQAFIAMHNRPWLVVVAPDSGGIPGSPQAFLVPGGGGLLGINYARNVWHHPLLALNADGDFLVVDRGGEGANLEEYSYDEVFRIESIPPA